MGAGEGRPDPGRTYAIVRPAEHTKEATVAQVQIELIADAARGAGWGDRSFGGPHLSLPQPAAARPAIAGLAL